MKKYWKLLTMAIVGAFVLNSCDDVPAPYPIPVTEGDVIEEQIEPEGNGTLATPYNVAKLNDLIDKNQAPTGEIYIKGIVSSIKSLDTSKYPRAQYYISDNGKTANQFYVYNGLYLNGANFTADDQIKVGDKVVILGSLTTYNDKYQVNQNSKIISLNGEGGSGEDPTPGPTPTDLTGDGSKDKPYTVTDVTTVYAATPSKAGVWVKGFIVGYVDGQKLAEGANFSATGNVAASNILLAASADETDYTKCLVIQLPVNDVRTRINLKDNPANLKQEVSLYGDIEKYFGVAGIKNTTKYVIGTETNDNGDNPTPSGDASAIDQDFTKGVGSWVIQNVDLGSVSYVWQQSTQFGMKASAYVNKTNNATEAWLVSPALAITTQTTITFNNCLNYLNSGTLSNHIALMVSTDYSEGLPSTATWTDLSFTPQPSGSSWTWVDSKADISAYANKTIHVAFKYVSTTSVAPTWEIKNVKAE